MIMKGNDDRVDITEKSWIGVTLKYFIPGGPLIQLILN
jgi:hypothetical protein